MTDELENVIQGEEPVADASSDAQPLETEEQRTFNSTQVKKVVEREKQKAFERGKREALMELQQQNPMEQQSIQQPFNNGQSVGLGGMKQLSPEDIERMIAEKAPQALQQHIQKAQQDQMINTFVSKMQMAEQKYPGLEAELNNLNYNDPRMHSFIAMANSMENTGDIMKEVLDNPTKMESMLNMTYNQPYQAQKALKSLSDSIKTNETAQAEEAQVRDPLSQVKSSTTAGTRDNQHEMSVKDIQRLLFKRR